LTGTLTFYDAAWPPARAPQTAGVCIYIGGDTPHVWTAAEIHAQTARYRLPVFVRSNPPGPGASADVVAAVRQLQAIGAPKGTLVAWDMETAADSAYIASVFRDLSSFGYQLIVYGSESAVLGNHNPDGLYWGADWTGTPHFAAHNVMTQYVSFSGYDEDLAEASLPFWDTHPAAPPVTTWQEAMMNALPELAKGATGAPVRTVQGLLMARGYSITLDGVFGPATDAVVRRFQGNAHLAADGVVGPKTWPALMDV
jgi:hypothetical protein